MGQKRFAVRTCAGCGARKTKNELIRVVRTKDGAVWPDPSGKRPGRGTYVCRSLKCLGKARKGSMSKRLRVDVTCDVWEALEREIADSEWGRAG